MTAATFGRWCFAAGWILALTLSAAYRLLDWPDWVGAGVALAVGLGGFRLIDRLAPRSARQLDSAKTTEHHVK
ncbi:hypothetical protein AB0I37_24970 [Micromonospora purpureochromogenes]|uniref:hypothetical protein n=1 Tax=Micromonospora purpureochromogenes TaxID=47872 RepID=UPI0033D99E81